MQGQEELEEKLDTYFHLAKNEMPIITAEEAGQVITNLPISEANKLSWKSYKNLFIAVGFTITAIALYLYYSSISITKTITPNDSYNILQNSNVNPIDHSVNLPKDSIFSEKLLDKVDEAPTIANSIKVGNSDVKEVFYYQGNAKVQFEEQGDLIELMIDEDVTQLKINNIVIEPENYLQYSGIIQKGKRMKAESDKLSNGVNSQENIEKEKNKQTLNKIISQLEIDQIVELESHFVFRLTGSKMYIDEIEQSDSLFVEYKKLYESVSGNRLDKKSNIKIKH